MILFANFQQDKEQCSVIILIFFLCVCLIILNFNILENRKSLNFEIVCVFVVFPSCSTRVCGSCCRLVILRNKILHFFFYIYIYVLGWILYVVIWWNTCWNDVKLIFFVSYTLFKQTLYLLEIRGMVFVHSLPSPDSVVRDYIGFVIIVVNVE